MKKSLLSILITTSVLTTTAHAGSIYNNKKGTTLDFSGTVIAGITTFDKDPSTVHGTAVAGDNRAITDQSFINLKLTGKSYFNDDGWYGIGHWYGRLKPKNSLENRELYAGVGSDKYGQLVYGKMYAAFYQGITVGDIALNYNGQSYDTPLPYRMQNRSTNTVMYSFHANNIDFYLSSMLNNGQYHIGSDSATPGSSATDKSTGTNSSQQVYGQYAFGKSGFSAGLGYAMSKMRINITQPKQKDNKNVWSTVGNLLFQSKNWFAAASVMTGQTYTTGSLAGDGMGKAMSGNFSYNPSVPFQPLASAKFYTALISTTYTIQQSTIGLMWSYGRYRDIEQGILTNKMAGRKSGTFANSLLMNYNYQINTHISAGIEYLYDTTKKSNPYHQGNGLYLQAAYAF